MNCKEELKEHVSEVKKDILCAVVKYEKEWGDFAVFKLTINYTTDDYVMFLKNLDFEYDAGFGGQEVCGNMWYTDGTWSERGEYDGSEWWDYKSCPDIPEELK